MALRGPRGLLEKRSSPAVVVLRTLGLSLLAALLFTAALSIWVLVSTD